MLFKIKKFKKNQEVEETEKISLEILKDLEEEISKDLKKLNEIEELSEEEIIKDLKKLDEIEELSEEEIIKDLEEFDKIEELSEEVEELDEIEEISEEETIKELEELDEIEELSEEEIIKDLEELDKVEELSEEEIIKDLEELDEIEELSEEVEELDKIEELSEEVEELDEIEELSEEVEELDEVVELSEEEKNRPVYILGDNALAYYLAIKLQTSGEKTVIIPRKENISPLESKGITLVENHNLQKQNHKLKTTFWLRETPKMLIITSDNLRINASLTSLSRKKLEGVPVLLFTPIMNVEYIRQLLKAEVYPAYFDGYLMEGTNNISLYGRNPSIILSLSPNNKHNLIIDQTLRATGINLEIETNPKKAFWEYFGTYSFCSIISALYNKNIFDIIKDRNLREESMPAIIEICKIANLDKADIDQDAIIKKIYNTPLGYKYPLQISFEKGKSGDLALISDNLISTAKKLKTPLKHTASILKKLYNIILA